ncbi:MAG: NADH:ubiquinone oxidoreductase subunit NDUFA12 [Alphaproteobacteria bacterium]|nr:NADH:ubiquinone oxidoreductase subunit NDUFA12 [Alphaproteobacteria bacterium]
MATIGTRLMTWWKGELVGQDQFGNRYYREKAGLRRWVLYRGMPEASKVPPEWHAWLHRTTDAVPAGRAAAKPWEKEHVPNLSGTAGAYRPPGSLLQGGRRPHATGDYEAWRPD